MSNKISTKEAMSLLGSMGGKANVRKHGKAHMAKISRDYQNSRKKSLGKTKGRGLTK